MKLPLLLSLSVLFFSSLSAAPVVVDNTMKMDLPDGWTQDPVQPPRTFIAHDPKHEITIDLISKGFNEYPANDPTFLSTFKTNLVEIALKNGATLTFDGEEARTMNGAPAHACWGNVTATDSNPGYSFRVYFVVANGNVYILTLKTGNTALLPQLKQLGDTWTFANPPSFPPRVAAPATK